MLIQHGNVRSRIIEATKEEYSLFRDILTFVVPNYWFAKSFKNKQWDGKYRFFYKQTFPTGLTFLLQEKISITIRKSRSRESLDIRPNILKSKFLTGKYAYQFDVVQQVLREETGLWHLATNSGKTVIAAALLQILSRKALYLVNSKDLLNQAYNLFTEEMDLPVGRLGAGIEDIATVTIGMPQTIVNRMKTDPVKSWLKSVEVVIADECHLASAKTWQTIFQKCTGARYRYGLSGTPLDRGELDNLKVMAYLGPVIARVTNQELIYRKVSSIPIVEFIEMNHFSEKSVNLFEEVKRLKSLIRITENEAKKNRLKRELNKLQRQSYPLAENECIVNNYVRNQTIVELTDRLVNNGEIVLILVKRIEHGKILEKMLHRDGISAVFRSGESTDEERTDSLQSLREKKSQVLVLSRIGELGLDIPSISSMIRASGGKSTVSTLQAIGRSLRNPTEDVNYIKFYDFYDKGVKFLEEHSKQRKKDYERENFEIRYRRLD